MFPRRLALSLAATAALIGGPVLPPSAASAPTLGGLTGRITMGMSGKAVPVAHVALINVDTDSWTSVNSESTGEFGSATGVAPGRYIVQVIAEGAFATFSGDTVREPDARIITVREGESFVVDIRLAPFAKVTGTVVDTTGKAVSSGDITVANTTRTGWSGLGVSQGRYTAGRLAAGRVLVTYVNESLSPQRYSVAVTARAGDTVTAPTIVVPLLVAGSLKGKVTGITAPRTELTRAIAIHASTGDQYILNRAYDGTVTGAVPVGKYRVVLTGTNVASSIVTVSKGSATSFGTLALPRTRTTIKGKIVQANGLPANLVKVRLRDSYGFELFAHTASTGEYSVVGAAKGSYTLRVEAPPRTTSSSVTTAAFSVGSTVTSVTKNVRLPRGYAITGTVTAVGAPVQDLLVKRVATTAAQRADESYPSTRTDSKGKFVLRGLATGTHTIAVVDLFPGGYRTVKLTVTISGANRTGLSITY